MQAYKQGSFAALHSTAHPSNRGNSSSWQTAAQQQRQQPPVDPQQLMACISAATSYHQLEVVCNTFLHNASFGSTHAALVLSKLHNVHSRHQDSQLLLVELLAAKLLSAATCSSSGNSSCSTCSSESRCSSGGSSDNQQLSPGEVAAVIWDLAMAGYQADVQLLEQLLQQFWAGYDCPRWLQQSQGAHEQPQQQQSVASCGKAADASNALATLIAGLAGLGFRDTAIWARLESRVLQSISDQSPASLQQIIWGLATAQCKDAALVSALAAAVADQLGSFSADELVQVVWCLHVLGHKDMTLFERASQHLVQEVDRSQSGTTIDISSSCKQLSKQQQQQARQPQKPSKQMSNWHRPQQASSSNGMVAALCSAAASQAYCALEKYDPLLSMLLLYKKLRPAHSC